MNILKTKPSVDANQDNDTAGMATTGTIKHIFVYYQIHTLTQTLREKER